MAKKEKMPPAVEAGLSAQPASKKIGFFSAMLIVMGSSIGAGIFFKAKGVLESSQGNLVFAIFAWLIAAFAVISMAIALLEIASARNDNLSLIGWCKTFNGRTIYKASKNFMFYLYLPLTYFFMPFYVIMSLQDALVGFGVSNTILSFNNASYDWIIWFIISLCISLFFIFVSGISSRTGNIMNKGIMAVKFLPLIAVPIIGFVMAGMSGANISTGLEVPLDGDAMGGISGIVPKATNFGRMSPFIGIFIAIGAIFFAYDGFYTTAGIQSEMKEPKKTPMAILLGLGVTTAIYLIIAISMSIGGNGGLFGMEKFLIEKNVHWLFGVINLTIAIGVLGIINGFAMWAPRFVEDLILENELPLSQRFKNKLNAKKPMIGIYYSLAITIPLVIVFTIIGAYGYQSIGAESYGSGYGSKEMAGIYAFSDLLGTWTAVLAFAFIAAPIYGGLKNRKSNFVNNDSHVHYQKNKHFVWSAWVSVIIIALALLIIVLDAFVNVFMLTQWLYVNPMTKQWDEKILAWKDVPEFSVDDMISRVMKLIMLLIFGGFCVVPTFIEDKLHIKKYGSIATYEKALGISPTFKTANIKF